MTLVLEQGGSGTLATEFLTWLAGFCGGVLTSYWFWQLGQPKTLDWGARVDTDMTWLLDEDGKSPVAGFAAQLRAKLGPDHQARGTTLRRILLRVVNTGHSAIRKDDFEEPIELRLTEGGILEAAVLATAPKVVVSLGQVEVKEDAVLLPVMPGHLNRGTWFDIELYVSGQGRVSVETHFVEATRPMREVQLAGHERLLQGVLRFVPGAIGAAGVGAVLVLLAEYVLATSPDGMSRSMSAPLADILSIIGMLLAIAGGIVVAGSAAASAITFALGWRRYRLLNRE